jgi:SSS family transporter
MSFGGFVAVAWSDVFQGTVMLLGLVALPVVFMFAKDSPAEVVAGIREIDPGLLSIWGAQGFSAESVAGIIGFLMIGLGYLGSPQLYVRFMSVRDTREIDKGKWVSVMLTLLMNTSAVSIGIIGRYFFTGAADDPLVILGNGGQNVLIMLAEALLPGLLSGFYIAAVLSAIMSTIDSLLVLASSAVARDFYQKIYHPELKDEQLSLFSKKVTLGLSLGALLLALSVALLVPGRTIFWFVIFGWSGIAATFCPVIILSIFWKPYTERGAIVSMLVGFVSVPLFKFAAPALPVVGIYFAKIAELLPSFLLAVIAGMLVSRYFRQTAAQSS